VGPAFPETRPTASDFKRGDRVEWKRQRQAGSTGRKPLHEIATAAEGIMALNIKVYSDYV
jgi:hypothetical protein